MRIDWWGHATTTVTLAGVRVLTDPVLTAHVAHLTRVGGPVPPAAAARADVVVVSHLHADHLHLPSLRRLPAGTRVVAPRGARGLLRRDRLDVTEVGPGEQVTVAGVELSAVPAEHDGRRLPGSRHTGPALGYRMTAGHTTGQAVEQSVWFAGDTGLFAGMADLGPVDVAIVPVGGWGPTLGPGHLDPAQAAEAVRLVGAHDAVPMHYGTLWPLGLRPVSRALFERRCRAPGRDFAAALAAGPLDATGRRPRGHVLQPGTGIEL